MEYTDQSLRLRLMMWIVEKRVFVSVCIYSESNGAGVATGRCEYKLS